MISFEMIVMSYESDNVLKPLCIFVQFCAIFGWGGASGTSNHIAYASGICCLVLDI